MKTTRSNKVTRLATAVALVAGAGGTVIACETSTSQGLVAKVIELRAQNNATPSVTVWIPKTAARIGGPATTAKRSVTKVIELHAANNPTASATSWPGK